MHQPNPTLELLDRKIVEHRTRSTEYETRRTFGGAMLAMFYDGLVDGLTIARAMIENPPPPETIIKCQCGETFDTFELFQSHTLAAPFDVRRRHLSYSRIPKSDAEPDWRPPAFPIDAARHVETILDGGSGKAFSSADRAAILAVLSYANEMYSHA
jgi:hypothetical protein